MNDINKEALREVQSLTGVAALSRRGFMLGSTAGGFALAVAPTGELLAQVINTDTQGLEASMQKVATPTGDLPVYSAKPTGKTGLATILVIQEIFGVHEHIQDVCHRFAKQGYLAIAPELYFRQGDPAFAASVAEIQSTIVSKVPDAQVMGDLDAVADWASRNGGDANRLGITGFCWGGRITWLYSARNPKIKAGVAWYGRLTGDKNAMLTSHAYDLAEQLKAPVLGLYGGADPGIPVATVTEMRRLLGQAATAGNAAAKASEFVVYPDAPHAFHADYRPTYRKEVAEDGWKRALEWFKRYL